MFWVELVVVLAMIVIGARYGGLGLGMMGGLGVAILSFLLGDLPSDPPVEVMLMIAAVVTAAGTLQAAGGMDYLVDLAEKALRKHPPAITFVAPLVAYVFTLFAGTGHVAYAILPVIAEVSRRGGRAPGAAPLHLGHRLAAGHHREPHLGGHGGAAPPRLRGRHHAGRPAWPCASRPRSAGVLAGALVASRLGKELDQDPEYQRRLAAGEVEAPTRTARPPATWQAKLSVVLFVAGAVAIVLFGSIPALRPTFDAAGREVQMEMADAIEMVMLSVAALMVIVCKAKPEKVATGSVFQAGMQAVIAIFGVAWMGDTFFKANQAAVQGPLTAMVQGAPWTFAIALFVMSILLYSQAATVRTLMPLGVIHRDAGLGAGRDVPGGERLLLPAQLPDAGGGHQLRPHRHHPHRQVPAQPQLHASRAGRLRGLGDGRAPALARCFLACTETPMAATPFRIEHDFLGDREVPADAYYGVQTLRGAENFPITGLPLHPALIRAMAIVKKAAALANRDTGHLDAKIADAIAEGRRRRHRRQARTPSSSSTPSRAAPAPPST